MSSALRIRLMDAVSQIFGAALDAQTRDMTAPQGAAAIASPAPAEVLSPEAVEEVPQTEPMTRMAELVNAAMRRNVSFRARSGVTERLQYALNANTNRFTDEQLAALSTVVPPLIAKKLFTSLTFTKTRGAKSRFVDVVNNAREPLFEVAPSPWPEVPESVDREVDASMMRDINTIFSAIASARSGNPIPPEQEALLLEVIKSTPSKRRDEIYGRRKEYANVRARRMQEKIWDMFVEGGGDKALSNAIANCCLYGTCFVIGPIPRVVACNKVVEENVKGENGVEDTVRRFVRDFRVKPVFESPNPMDCYPAPDAKNPADGPFCIREKYTAESLWRFSNGGATRDKNGEGWNEEVVRALLAKYPNGGVKFHMEPEDQRKKDAEMNGGAGDTEDCTFEAVRCFMSVRGSELAEIGIVQDNKGKKIVLGDFYHVEAIVIDSKVVYCRILDARLDVPISKGVFYELPGAFWGESIADKLAFVQMMQNNTAKALFLDLGATGPMVWINQAQRLLDKSPDALRWRPYGFLRFGDEMYAPSGANGAPMGVLDIPTKAAQLIREFEEWQSQADIDSGIPRFAEGQTSGAMGALRTSGGLAQMTEHMMIVVKMVAMLFDDGIIKPTAQRCADWILANDDDQEIKGDVYIRPVGMFGRMLKAQLDSARMQFFQIMTSNPQLMQLLGPKLALAIARPIVKGLDINADADFPSEEHARWLEQMNKLAALAAAEKQAVEGMQQEQGVAAPPAEGAPAPGSVAERRSVA